jgi:hypothetical protein
VGTATRYELGGSGIESLWGRDFPHPFRPALGPTHPLIQFRGVTRPGRGVNHPPPSSTEVKERVQLYRYSFSGPSLPVQGHTLTLPDESGTGYGPLMGCCAQDSEQLFYIT